MQNIRNFSIIAHVDHGKSTLADRILEITNTIPKEKMKEQLLDQLDIERERGITIKLQPVRIKYHSRGTDYTLNLIDTPGHVDFTYEVSRSLAAVEGALLLVDATKGIEAQTLAHAYLSIELGLTLIPVINKVDMMSTLPSPSGEVKVDLEHPLIQQRIKEITETFGFRDDEILFASGKTGFGVEKILKAIVERISPPSPSSPPPLEKEEEISYSPSERERTEGSSPAKDATVTSVLQTGVDKLDGGFKALVFDSVFDPHLGVLAFVRVFSGDLSQGAKIKFLGTKAVGEAVQLGYFLPSLSKSPSLQPGDIGYIATGLKSVKEVRVGDTVTNLENPTTEPVAGFREIKPFVFASIYPVDGARYEDLRTALSKMKLNDASLTFDPENSQALGFGFRCGFLGLLHMEVVQERLEREFNLELIATAPTVKYLVTTNRDEELEIETPDKFPIPELIKGVKEPWIDFTIFSPEVYVGAIMDLVNKKRGEIKNIEYLPGRAKITGQLPLAELVIEFYDKLKSVSSGFASLDYELTIYKLVEAAKLDILVAGENVDALSQIVVKEKVDEIGRKLVEKLKEEIPRQNFEVAIQAAVGGRIVARSDVKAYRKDVIAKLYGGDVTRKNKLLDKQAKGKKRMKRVGRVEIPQEAFLAILKI